MLHICKSLYICCVLLYMMTDRTTIQHLYNDIGELKKETSSINHKVDIMIGKMNMLETFLMSPKRTFLGNVSPSIRKIEFYGSIFAITISLFVFIVEIVPKLF